jgi:hypothetical protein
MDATAFPKVRLLYPGKSDTMDMRDLYQVHFAAPFVTVTCYTKDPGKDDPGFEVMVGSHKLAGNANNGYSDSVKIPIEDESVHRGEEDSFVEVTPLMAQKFFYIKVE